MGSIAERQVAREISYAHSARSRAGRIVIRALENATGRLRLIRRAIGYQDEVASGTDFWEVMVRRYGLTLDITGGTLVDIPAGRPVVVVANHPYGILDGLLMGHLLSRARGGDFRILAHEVFRKAPDLRDIILPIDFDQTRAARDLNLKTRAEALSYLAAGGAIGVFPGGTVSTAARPWSRAMDPLWRAFTARMIAKSGATVVPIFFEGTNSRLFQLASHLHSTLRMGLLIGEFRRRTDTRVRVVIGDRVPAAEVARNRADAKALMDFLRARTYALSPESNCPLDYGLEFEAKYRRADADGGRDLR